MADADLTALGFDPAALREKYRIEREKRLRADANDQYRPVDGVFAHYLDDPYVAPGFTRAPISEPVDVLIVGGGFGGMLTAARLRECGIDSIRIVEKAGDFGGTWYWNRYPGAACDIESYIYLPLLEEAGYVPVEKYSKAPEILAYSRMVGDKLDLYRHALFQTEVQELRWDAADARWIVSTDRGDRIVARFVVTASGPLNRPKLPGIPGIERFGGHSFHTSRWDYGYTGGDSYGNLTGLADKRVGIIGTGATAVQCIPHLGASAKHLYVFQRTPSSVDVRANRPTDPDWARTLEPGWQRRRMENFNALVSGVEQKEDLVADGWTDIFYKFSSLIAASDGARAMALADFEKMEAIRARVDALVKDPATADALKPYYNLFCKRPCFHDEYLETFNRANVTLVDTQGRGVERITPRSVVANGVEYDVDCLIYATGFEVGTDYTRRSGFEIVGRDGLTLTSKWRDGAATLHGMHSRGFPNLLIVSTVQATLTPNLPHMLDDQARHAAYIVGECRKRRLRSIEASQEAEDGWIDTIVNLGERQRAFLAQCTPGYYNNEGHPTPASARNATYGAGSIAFLRLLADWRADGNMAGLELTAE